MGQREKGNVACRGGESKTNVFCLWGKAFFLSVTHLASSSMKRTNQKAGTYGGCMGGVETATLKKLNLHAGVVAGRRLLRRNGRSRNGFFLQIVHNLFDGVAFRSGLARFRFPGPCPSQLGDGRL